MLINNHLLKDFAPNEVDENGDNAFILAVKTRNIPMVDKVLQIPGINYNLQNNDEQTALFYVNNVKMLQFLKEKNALPDPRIRNKQLQSIINIHTFIGNDDMLAFFREYESVN